MYMCVLIYALDYLLYNYTFFVNNKSIINKKCNKQTTYWLNLFAFTRILGATLIAINSCNSNLNA